MDIFRFNDLNCFPIIIAFEDSIMPLSSYQRFRGRSSLSSNALCIRDYFSSLKLLSINRIKGIVNINTAQLMI